MSYEQHTWADGETITANKLNNIEAGIIEASQSGGGLEIVSVTFDSAGPSLVLSKTWQELHDGMLAGTLYAVNVSQSEYSGWSQSPRIELIYNIKDDSSYGSGCIVNCYDSIFLANNQTDYPSMYIGD